MELDLWIAKVYEGRRCISKEYYISEDLAKEHIAGLCCGVDGKRYRERTYTLTSGILRGASTGSVVKVCSDCHAACTHVQDWQRSILEDSAWLFQSSSQSSSDSE